MPDIFLSHSTKDNEFTRFLFDRLSDEGFNVWVDFDDISPGDRWLQTIENGLRESKSVVFVLSKNSRDSEWCEREALMTMQLKKPLHVVLIEDLPLPLHLINRQYTDFREGQDKDQAVNDLVEAIRELDLEGAEPKKVDLPKPLPALPTEDNFFQYLEQLPGGENNSLIARDLYQWGQTHADKVEFGGKITPGFHVKVQIGEDEITLFSVWGYAKKPSVQVQFQYLMEYDPYKDTQMRRSTLKSLSKLVSTPFIDDKADRRPTLRIKDAFSKAENLEDFKQVMGEIIDNLKGV